MIALPCGEKIAAIGNGSHGTGAALTTEELRLRRLLQIAGTIFFCETLVYLLPALAWGTTESWVQLPFVANSFVKSMFFAGLCALAASDIRRFSRAVTLIVVGLVAWVLAAIAILIWGKTGRVFEIFGIELSMTAILWMGIGLQGGLAVGFAYFHRKAVKARYGLSYLAPGQFRTVEALAECLLPADVTLAPEQVAMNVDAYLKRFEATRKWVMKAALVGISVYPLFYLHLPLTLIAVDQRREFLEKHFRGDVARRRIGSLRRWLVQAMIRLGQQVVYLGYYGDPASWDEVGYVPFSRRGAHDVAALRKRPGGLEVDRGPLVQGSEIEAEIAIVGSGAAASVIAHHLVSEGKRVVMVERGRHEDPADFTEDEGEMLARLYRDGAVQLARDFRLQVLQGMCVGGTTVVNNAVSIPPPEEIVDGWNERLGGALEGLDGDVAAIQKLLDINEQPAKVFARGVHKFLEGVEKLELESDARRFHAVEANIRDCLGCGYCNIGCAYGRKLSMLDTLLPQAQAMDGPGELRIVSECAAEGIETSNGRIDSIACRAEGRKLRLRADRFVVAAGAVSSSYLLARSGVGGAMAGQGLGFNVGSPMTAEFEERLDTYAGLQITHVYQPRSKPDYVMETWFNPVLSQALAMPGWFEDHRRNMLRYAYMAATGVIVGTKTNGRVEKATFGGADVVYTPDPEDLARLLAGLKLAGRIYLEAGARRVMPATFEYHSFADASELDRLDELITDSSDIQLGTGHPQGGNALGLDPADGVVDPRSFRVHGTSNLYLCDASVFPTTIGVNPQLTVMSLAHRAAPLIAAGA